MRILFFSSLFLIEMFFQKTKQKIEKTPNKMYSNEGLMLNHNLKHFG